MNIHIYIQVDLSSLWVAQTAMSGSQNQALAMLSLVVIISASKPTQMPTLGPGDDDDGYNSNGVTVKGKPKTGDAWKVLVVSRLTMAPMAPYLKPDASDWANPRNLQPTLLACEHQCRDIPGCFYGTYVTAGDRAKECWLSGKTSRQAQR